MHGGDRFEGGQDDPGADALPGDQRGAIEAEWREVNYLLEVGELTWRDAIAELFERDLIRKSVGITPAGEPEPGADIVHVLEVSRERLVPGPRLLHAIHGSRGWGVLGGRLYRPVSSQVRVDTGRLSGELPQRPEDRAETPEGVSSALHGRDVEDALTTLIERVGAEAAWRWLRAPHPALGGESPLHVIVAHGIQRVHPHIETLVRPPEQTTDND